MKFVFDTCRICMGNAIDGRLISPCVCKGSMKYIHVDCLEKWRHASRNRKHFFECELCKYNYSFWRTWLISMLRNRNVIHMTTVLACIICFFVSNVILQCIGITLHNSSIFCFLLYASVVFSVYWIISMLFTLHDPIGSSSVLYTMYRFMQYYIEVVFYKAEYIIENV